MKLVALTADFRAVLEAKRRGDFKLLNEVSLARAYGHVRNGQFAILTNHRAGQTPMANRDGFYQLKQDLVQLGCGPIVLWGRWQECQDPQIPYQECPPELIRDVSEPSLFVPNLDLETASHYAGLYDQDAFVYCGPETDGKVNLVYRDGSRTSIGDFHPDKIAQAYSQLKNGRSFVFEYVAQSHTEVLIELAASR